MQGLPAVFPSIWGWDVYNRKINPTQGEGGEGRGLDKEIGRPVGDRQGWGERKRKIEIEVEVDR